MAKIKELENASNQDNSEIKMISMRLPNLLYDSSQISGRKRSFRNTAMLGQQLHKGGKSFEWPSKTEISFLSKHESFELSHLVMKGGNNKYLQGIGLMFTNGFISPI